MLELNISLKITSTERCNIVWINYRYEKIQDSCY